MASAVTMLLALLAAATAAAAPALSADEQLALLRVEVELLRSQLRDQGASTTPSASDPQPPRPPPEQQQQHDSLPALSEAEQAWLRQASPALVDVFLREDDTGLDHPLNGFARYPAEVWEKQQQQVVTPRRVNATGAVRQATTLTDDRKALCYFYTDTRECDRDPFCQWARSESGVEKCAPAPVTCNTAALNPSQCVGPNSEFSDECQWSCACAKKAGDEHASGGDHGAAELCSCPKMEDNPYHIHSQDTCKMKKFYYADGTIDETCYIEQTCGHNGHHGHEPPYNVLFITGSFGVGAFFRYWGPKIAILDIFPYTVLIFSLGTGFGFLTNLGYPLSNYDGLAHMDPHEIFFIFLPILIFESAFATDFHIFKKVIVGCLLLAGPGIMIAALLTGTIAKFAFIEYEWSWVTSLLFGTVLSATDPVAVVALLKELGASPEISTMIEGESLFNDGTAIALFGILKEAVPTGEITKSAPEMFLEFCKISFGGPAVGFVIGFLVKLSLSAVFNDALVEVTVTVFAAYLTFFIAEGFFGVSGVLGLVAFGCFLSFHRACVSPEVEHTLHHFWEITVYMTNTLIFGLSGLIVSQKAFKGIKPVDYLYLLITYVGINIVRGLVVTMFMPILKHLPYKLDTANAVLVTWGGLRGAVGLALGLIVAGDSTILCSHPQLGSRFLFHVSGIVVGTLLVNGVTTKLVVQKLGLDKIPDHKILDMKKAHEQLVAHQEEHLRGLMRQPVLADTNWQKAKQYSMDDLDNPYGEGAEVDVPEKEARIQAYVKLIKQAVIHEFEEGNVGGKSARKLTALCARCLEENRYLFATDLEGLFRISVEWKFLMWLTSPFPLARTSIEQASREALWAHAFDVGIGFVNAHDRCSRNVGVLLPKKSANDVVRHCKVETIELLKLLEWYTKEMPEIAVSIKTRHASRHILNAARGYCHNMEHRGMIDEEATHALVHEVEKKMKDLRYIPNAVEPADINEVLRDHHGSWFNTPGSSLHFQSNRRYTVEKFQKGVQIGEKGVEGCGFYAITLGVVRVHIQGKAQYFGPGFCCNILPALTGNTDITTTRYSECFAETAVVAAFISAAAIEDAVASCGEVKHALWTQVGRQVSEHILAVTPPYSQWPPDKLREICHAAKLEPVTADRKTPHSLSTANVNILINGSCSEVPKSQDHKPEIIKEPMRLEEIVARNCLFWKNAVLVTVKDALGAKEKARKNWQKLRSWMRTVRTIAGLIGPEAVRDALALALKVPTLKQLGVEATNQKSDAQTWQKEFEGQVLRKRDRQQTIFSPGSPASQRRGTFNTAANRQSVASGSTEGHPLKPTESNATSVRTPEDKEADQLQEKRRQREKERRLRDEERSRRDRERMHRRELREKKAERRRILEEAGSLPSDMMHGGSEVSSPAYYSELGHFVGSPAGPYARATPVGSGASHMGLQQHPQQHPQHAFPPGLPAHPAPAAAHPHLYHQPSGVASPYSQMAPMASPGIMTELPVAPAAPVAPVARGTDYRPQMPSAKPSAPLPPQRTQQF